MQEEQAKLDARRDGLRAETAAAVKAAKARRDQAKATYERALKG